MTKVLVVTACVDLGLSKRPLDTTHKLGQDLINACENKATVYNPTFEENWLWQEYPNLPAANARAEDRFATDDEHVRSNYAQHMPVQMLEVASKQIMSDVYVWLGYTLLKQGDFTGKKITADHVRAFIERLKSWEPTCIPFPGITPRAPVNPHGDNWRFCGSTIIAPRKWLPQIVHSYKYHAREFVRQHKSVPLDLAIWPAVEENSGLPWRFYQSEYDFTQLSNFPC